MREYSKIGPQFWIGSTGKRLRAAGVEAQLVGMYLLTSPHANMLGLYYLPVSFISHETGLTLEGASKGLLSSIEAHFCSYDHASEMVWVHEMARYQIGAELLSADKRCKGIQNEYDSLPENPYLSAFYDRYGVSYSMTKRRGNALKTPSPSEAPSKPHRSQEQEQEQEQEPSLRSGGAPAAASKPAEKPKTKGSRLPADWTLPPEWRERALKAGMLPDAVDRCAVRFANYFIAKAGRDAARTDWLRTWDNWYLKELEDRPLLRAPPPPPDPNATAAVPFDSPIYRPLLSRYRFEHAGADPPTNGKAAEFPASWVEKAMGKSGELHQ